MKNVAIALNAGQPSQRNAITKFLGDQKWAYWHWIDDFWIVQLPDNYTPQVLYQNLEALEGGAATILVFEFSGRISYWGRASKDAWDWLSKIGSPG